MVLGAVQWVAAEGGNVLIGNCVTQDSYGHTGIHVNYDAVRTCMRRIASASAAGVPGTRWERGFSTVAMPRIGAGLAGGDWRRIEEIVETELACLDLTVCVQTANEIPSWRRDRAEAAGTLEI